MNILIIGNGGREHALANTYSKSKNVKKVFVVPGNDLMTFSNNKIQTFSHIKVTDFETILKLAKKEKVYLVDVAQDDPLSLGFVNKFEKEGIIAFGPSQKAAEIEWSKEWSRNFMIKYNLPIPKYQSFNDEKNAINYIESLKNQVLYIKASGLATGKGAIRAENKEETITAIKTMKQFGNAGQTFLIEECMKGQEFSLFAISDGVNYKILNVAQDHKTVYENDKGPNTGGMGCISPTKVINNSMIKIIELKILKPFMKGMQKEGRPYKGILYLGGMLIDNKKIKIVEFNARWGDPEAEVILPSIQTDYLKLIESITMNQLKNITIKFDNKVRISIAGCAAGYPNDYSEVKGKKIYGIEEASRLKDIIIFGAGIKKEGKHFVVNGGRIFHLVAEGKDIKEARRRAYEAMSMIYIEDNNLHYRTDIGWRDVERL